MLSLSYVLSADSVEFSSFKGESMSLFSFSATPSLALRVEVPTVS